jgi:predicted nucleic acid-binding protein
MIVSNAGPLIYLAKVNSLHLLKKLYREVVLPPAALDEISKGKMRGMVDALAIENAIKEPEAWLRVEKLTAKQLRTVEALTKTVLIHRGEAEAIVLARDLREPLLMDDRAGRKVAEIHDIACFGTIAVLLDAVWARLMSERDAKTLLNKIVAAGFNLDVQTYAEFCRRLGMGRK